MEYVRRFPLINVTNLDDNIIVVEIYFAATLYHQIEVRFLELS